MRSKQSWRRFQDSFFHPVRRFYRSFLVVIIIIYKLLVDTDKVLLGFTDHLGVSY